jgi:serine/threonine protein kinase
MSEVGVIHCDLKPENILLKGEAIEDGIKARYP